MTNDEEFDDTELQALQDALKALPRDITPPSEAWASIRERIEQTRVRELVPGAPTIPSVAILELAVGIPFRWLRSPRTAFLVAATLFIAVTTIVVRRENSIDVRNASTFAQDTANAGMTGVFARYDVAATELANNLKQRRDDLNPETAAVIDSCLTTIDHAIRETRSALDNAPDNATFAGLLEVTYQQKLDLLRRATELSAGSF